MKVARWVAVGLAGVILTGCSTVQREADEEAARVADQVLPGALDGAIASSGAQSLQERGDAAADWLADPGPSAMDGQGGTTWVVRDQDGATIRLDVYAWVESGSFFPPDQGKALWGLACRSYDVAAGVTSTPVECPEGTPAAP